MSEIRATTISNLAGTGPATLTKQSAAKAWANFNGTGTIAARDSFNVSSLTDNGVGNYNVNFTNAFDASEYCGVDGITGGGTATSVAAPTSASSFQHVTYAGGTLTDNSRVMGSHFGDLA